jgi:hypothetical protein
MVGGSVKLRAQVSGPARQLLYARGQDIYAPHGTVIKCPVAKARITRAMCMSVSFVIA